MDSFVLPRKAPKGRALLGRKNYSDSSREHGYEKLNEQMMGLQSLLIGPQGLSSDEPRVLTVGEREGILIMLAVHLPLYFMSVCLRVQLRWECD